MKEDQKTIPNDNPYEILRVYRDENFIEVPSSDDTDRRARCNELILATNECLNDFDARNLTILSDAALAELLQNDLNPLVIAEAVRRLEG